MKEITLRSISHEEHKECLRKEIEKDGLYEVVKKRCDAVNDECKFMRYVQHRYIHELLCEIIELVEMR